MPSTTSSHASRAADLAAPEPDLRSLAERLGHDFADPSLLRRAVSHRSWCAEVPGHESNERLEFLGDAVLGWAIADIVFHRHADLPEGKLTDLRKSVVNATALADVARSVDIGSCILLGKGERAAGGCDKPSILSDALEAVIGAVYLDGGAPAAAALIERLFAAPLREAATRLDRLDFKTLLQEATARRWDVAPVYVISDSGPDHEKTFVARVLVDGSVLGEGQGRSKKVAEQLAAAEAYDRIAAGATPATSTALDA